MDKHGHDRFMEALERLACRAQADCRRSLPARLTPQTLQALNAVGGRDGANLNELAAEMRITSPSACVLVRRLIKLGYVDKKIPPHNHRVVTLHLTAPGRKILQQDQTFRRKLAEKILAPLSKQKQKELVDSLDKITVPHPDRSDS